MPLGTFCKHMGVNLICPRGAGRGSQVHSSRFMKCQIVPVSVLYRALVKYHNSLVTCKRGEHDASVAVCFAQLCVVDVHPYTPNRDVLGFLEWGGFRLLDHRDLSQACGWALHLQTANDA